MDIDKLNQLTSKAVKLQAVLTKIDNSGKEATVELHDSNNSRIVVPLSVISGAIIAHTNEKIDETKQEIKELVK